MNQSNQLNQAQKPPERQQEVLTMLRRVMHRYEQQGRLTNDHYLSVKAKYNYILQGGQYKVVEATEELKNMISFVGGQIPTLNYKSGGEMINRPGITWERRKKELKYLIVKC